MTVRSIEPFRDCPSKCVPLPPVRKQSGMKKLLYWAIWLIGITACVNPKGKEVLAEAERLMQASPDSALLVLEQAKKEAATYSRRNRMRYLLLRAEAMNKAYLRLFPLAWQSGRADACLLPDGKRLA